MRSRDPISLMARGVGSYASPAELHEALKMNDDRIKAEVFRENLENDDCGIIAAMAVTGLSYASTRDLLQEVFRNTTSGRGINRNEMFAALRDAGWTVEEVEVPYNCTVAMVPDRFPRGRYFVGCPGHIMALIDGELFNSRGNWGAPCDGIAHVDDAAIAAAARAAAAEQATRSKRV